MGETRPADDGANRVLTPPGVHCDLHEAKPGGAPVELCITDGSRAQLAGRGSQQGRKQPPTAIRVNDLLWSLFSSL